MNTDSYHLETCVKMLYKKDPYTAIHSVRVALYATKIASLIDFNIEECMQAALLHDIGKLEIPDEILKKPGRLTNSEYALIKLHPILGISTIENLNIPISISIKNGILYHHERWDGKGYPCNLKGEEIPYISRIISLADSIDSMASDRVYRKKLPFSTLISELKQGIGTQFDPCLCEIVISALKRGKLKIIT